MTIRVCMAGATGKTGSEVTRAILGSNEFELTGAIGRRSAGQDVGSVLGLPTEGITVASTLAEATLTMPADGPMQTGGRTGRHTEQFSYLVGELQVLARAHPGATW